MLGDKVYDSAELREDLHERGTKPIIPNRCNRKQPFSFSKRIYKLRWRIESKDLRRIATRYAGLCLPRRCSCMVDLMSLDPSTF
jgi:IS5 family transposase